LKLLEDPAAERVRIRGARVIAIPPPTDRKHHLRLLDLYPGACRRRFGDHRAPTDAHALCRRILEELQAGIPDVRSGSRPREKPTGPWDADRLEQVVSNLVSNALQYGPPGTAINVDSRGTATD